MKSILNKLFPALIILAFLLPVAITSCPTESSGGSGGGKKTPTDVIDLDNLKAGAQEWGKVEGSKEEGLKLIVEKVVDIKGTMDTAKSLVIDIVDNVTVTVNAAIKAAAGIDSNILIDI